VGVDDAEIDDLDRWWRAANYLAVGQIYLLDNPLLREPLKPEHIKPRLLGHWGTTPGLNLIHTHLNRVIRNWDLDVIFVAGPGHGGPAMVASTYLEGTYSELYPSVSTDEAGLKRLFRQFSFPGGIGSHVTAETPGSIHEGGELGYSLAHAFGAAFDNPDLLVACVVGDGESETGPLATSWHAMSWSRTRICPATPMPRPFGNRSPRSVRWMSSGTGSCTAARCIEPRSGSTPRCGGGSVSSPISPRCTALPPEWRARWPLRKFGFHGLSHAYIARRVASLTGRDDARIVSCHLGSGASLCAIAHGRSVETTMGFTPLDGLVMATRSGSVDPGWRSGWSPTRRCRRPRYRSRWRDDRA
jgi:hypothetical protein